MNPETASTRRSFFSSSLASLTVLAGLSSAPNAIGAEKDLAPMPATPGLTGFGARTWAGNTPDRKPVRVEVITRLDDYGKDDSPIPGTLRYAVTNDPARKGGAHIDSPSVVILAAEGTVKLKEDLVVSKPYTTVIGKAPGAGTVLSDGRVIIRTHDVLWRNIKGRPGDFDTGGKLSDRDAITLWGRKDDKMDQPDSVFNVVIDRCSLGFYCDEGVSTYQRVTNITISNCIIGYGLAYTEHGDIDKTKGRDGKNHHSMGILFAPEVTNFTFTGNVCYMTMHRMPRVMPGATGEITNNIFCGFGPNPGDKFYAENTKVKLTEVRSVRVQNNQWIQVEGVSAAGPLVSMGKAGLGIGDDTKMRLYFAGNELVAANGKVISTSAGVVDTYLLKTDTCPRPLDPPQLVTANKLLVELTPRVGARSPEGKLDDLDASILMGVSKRTGKVVDTVVPGKTKVNGFNVIPLSYTYPPAGKVADIRVPDGKTRTSDTAYSALEQYLWEEPKK